VATSHISLPCPEGYNLCNYPLIQPWLSSTCLSTLRFSYIDFSTYQRSYWRNLFPCKVFILISMFFGSATCWKLYFSFPIDLSKFQAGIIVKIMVIKYSMNVSKKYRNLRYQIKGFTASLFSFICIILCCCTFCYSLFSFMTYWYVHTSRSLIC